MRKFQRNLGFILVRLQGILVKILNEFYEINGENFKNIINLENIKNFGKNVEEIVYKFWENLK